MGRIALKAFTCFQGKLVILMATPRTVACSNVKDGFKSAEMTVAQIGK